MPLIEHRELIKAPVEVCFDVARDAGIYRKINSNTKHQVLKGVNKRLLEEGDTVTWEVVFLGVRKRIKTKVIFMEEPLSFVSVIAKGPCRSFIYIHEFTQRKEGTIMYNHFQYKSRLGLIGVLVDKLFLKRYMRSYIVSRVQEIKKIAENRVSV